MSGGPRHGVEPDGGKPDWLHRLPEKEAWPVGVLITGVSGGREVRLADCGYTHSNPHGGETREQQLAALVQLRNTYPEMIVSGHGLRSWWRPRQGRGGAVQETQRKR